MTSASKVYNEEKLVRRTLNLHIHFTNISSVGPAFIKEVHAFRFPYVQTINNSVAHNNHKEHENLK